MGFYNPRLDLDGGYRLLASVPAGASGSVKATADFIQWRQVAAVVGSSAPLEVVDTSAAGQARSFYRLGQDLAMFRGDLSHSGVYRTRGVPALPSILWKFPTRGPVYSSPVLVNNLLYIGSNDTNFYALNAETGTEVWRFETGGAIRSSPAIAAGTAYFCGRDGLLYALNAQTGAERWRFKLAEKKQMANIDNWDLFDSSPAVDGGTIWHNYRETHLTFPRSYLARLHCTHAQATSSLSPDRTSISDPH